VADGADPLDLSDLAVTGRGAGAVLALRNWRVASRLILLVAIPTALGLAFAGLRVSGDTSNAAAAAQVSRLAVLGQQVTGLTQALEEERAGAVAFIAEGSPATGLGALRGQYASTNSWAVRVRQQARRVDSTHPLARTRGSVATALASIAALPGLRRDTAQSQASALNVANGYDAAITGLFPVIDAVADQSADPALITSVRALGALASLKDQVSQQQAVLGAALTEGRFEPGSLTALAVAQAQQAGDLAAFRASATAEESWALSKTLTGPQARQATAVEQRAMTVGGGTLALGTLASRQWQSGTSYTIGWMRHAEQQLAGWVTADAQARQRAATGAAMVTGGLALAGLLLALLIALIIGRSVVRPLRRLEAAALDAAHSLTPAKVRALTTASGSRRIAPELPFEVSPGDEIGQVARAFDRLRQEALWLAAEEARLRDGASVVVASYFRRSHALHDRLLGLIDSIEFHEDDPERLARLFEADNLATQMRRHSDTALVLAGHETPRRWTEPVALVDVLRAAASEIERYDRVDLDVQPGVLVSGGAAVDTVHLLAELLENATNFSPEASPVHVSGFREPDGQTLIKITDAGPGVPAAQLRWLNWQLAHPVVADEAVAQQLGLFAVSHLAARHGISVVLTQPPDGGTCAEVLIPAEVISLGDSPGGRSGALGADYGRSSGAAPAANPLALPPRFNSGPQLADDGRADDRRADDRRAGDSSAGGGESAGGPEAVSDDLPLILNAPVPAPAPQPPGALPIFNAVEAEHARTADPVDPDAAQAAGSRLTSFQQGARRGRAAAREDHGADQAADSD
jgi:signal transduction histidine kinase